MFLSSGASDFVNGQVVYVDGGLLAAIWFCFLPNAPYLITDLMHLRYNDEVPLIYDVGMHQGEDTEISRTAAGDCLLRYGVPSEISAKYAVALLDGKGRVLAGTSVPPRNPATQFLPWAAQPNEYEVPVSPVGNGLIVRAQAYRTSLGVIGSGLFWLVGALAAMTAWMLIANWRHTRRRITGVAARGTPAPSAIARPTRRRTRAGCPPARRTRARARARAPGP